MGWAGQATHKRFSSPRPRKAPGCTVLMTLFLRSLWEAVKSLHTSVPGLPCSLGGTSCHHRGWLFVALDFLLSWLSYIPTQQVSVVCLATNKENGDREMSAS